MSVKYHDCLQGSHEWDDLRGNKLTATDGQAISAQQKGLITAVKKAVGLLPKPKIDNEWTNRGLELEPLAAKAFEKEIGIELMEVGFITNSKYERVGISPDRVAHNKTFLVEIKCLNIKKHELFCYNKKIDSKYMWQMQMQMLISEINQCYYVLYHPDHPEPLKYVIVKPIAPKVKKLISGMKKGLRLIKKYEAV